MFTSYSNTSKILCKKFRHFVQNFHDLWYLFSLVYVTQTNCNAVDPAVWRAYMYINIVIASS